MATIDQVIKELQEMKSREGNSGETKIMACIFEKSDFSEVSQEEWDEYMEYYSFAGLGVEPHLHIDIETKIWEHIEEHINFGRD